MGVLSLWVYMFDTSLAKLNTVSAIAATAGGSAGESDRYIMVVTIYLQQE